MSIVRCPQMATCFSLRLRGEYSQNFARLLSEIPRIFTSALRKALLLVPRTRWRRDRSTCSELAGVPPLVSRTFKNSGLGLARLARLPCRVRISFVSISERMAVPGNAGVFIEVHHESNLLFFQRAVPELCQNPIYLACRELLFEREQLPQAVDIRHFLME